MVTIKEIARLTNVSPTTVANVIHGRTSKVSPQNVERIQKALKEHNYVSKMGLEALTKGKTRLILVIAHAEKHYQNTPIEEPFYSKILGVLEREIRQAQHYMMLCVDDNDDTLIQTAMSWNVAGIITITFTEKSYQKVCSLVDCPVVGIDTYTESGHLPPQEGYHVSLNDYEAGRFVGNFLCHSGFRNMMFISDAKSGPTRLRSEGFQDVLNENQIEYHNLFLGIDSQKRIRQLKTLFPLSGKQYALFCSCDQIAFEAISVLSEYGYSVPNDFSVFGFDDNPYSVFSVPKLTTMHQDISRKAHVSCELLFHLINGDSTDEGTILLPVELMLRESLVPLN